MPLLGKGVLVRASRFVIRRPLSDLAQPGREQGRVEGTHALQRAGIDDQVGQRIEVAYRADVPHLGPLDAQSFAPAVDAFGAGALVVDPLVERTLAIQRDAHLPPEFPVEVLDTAFLLEELRMVAGLSARFRKKQGTAKALRQVAIGVGELEGGIQTQSFGTQGHTITVALALRMAMLVERDGGHTPATGHRLVGVPGIEGGIGGDVGREEPQGGDRADGEGEEVGDVVLVEGLGELGQDHITIASNGCTGHAGAIAPEVFLFLFRRTIGLLLVGGAFDAQLASGVPCGLLIFLEALFDLGTRVVLFDVGINVGDIEGHRFAQARDFLAQGLDGGDEQGLQHGLREGALFLGEPASSGHGALDIKAVGLGDIEHGTRTPVRARGGDAPPDSGATGYSA